MSKKYIFNLKKLQNYWIFKNDVKIISYLHFLGTCKRSKVHLICFSNFFKFFEV